ncbi:MAG TPA: winged helix-turn-helix domain-containing protein [Pirellulaceae bacterium]|nr:winged helix-turn-helix domain-containing protein [Pirellulaceae bacterium]
MPIPDFQSLMLPLLQLAADGAEHSLADARTSLAEQLPLTDEERAELLPSGHQPRFNKGV